MKLKKEVNLNSVWNYDNDGYLRFSNKFSYEELENLYKMEDKKVKLTLEVKDPILDETEREYLSGVIRPFRDDVEFICKNSTNVDSEYINIGYYKNDNTLLPCFKKGSMYKNMTLNKEYTLEELGL